MGGCSVVYPPGYVPGNLIILNTTVLNASQIGDDVVGPVDTLAIYCDTTIGSTGNRRTVAHYGGTIEYLAAAEEFKVDARTVVHTGTEGALEVELTTGTATGVKGIKVDMITGNLINGAWAYGFYADMNVTAAATATSNAADLYLAAPVGDTVNMTTYGLYIEAGFDFGLAILSPVKLSSLTIAPTADPTPYPLNFELEGWPTANVYSQGRVINMDYGAARTLDAALYGLYMDFRTNVTLGGQTVTGVYVDIGTTGTANPGIGMTVAKTTTNSGAVPGTVSGSIIGLNITSIASGGAGCTVIDGTVGIGISTTVSDAGGGEVMTVENTPLAITYVSAGGTPIMGNVTVMSATIPAGFEVSGASTVRGLYMGFSPVLNNAGANFYGMHIDLDGVTETAKLAHYGTFIQMPAAYAGGGVTAAIYATGNGNIYAALIGDGMRITMTEAAATAIKVIMNNTGATTGIDIDLVQKQSGNVIIVDFSAAETLTGALTGVNMDFSTNVTPAAQVLTGINIILPTNIAATSSGMKMTSTQAKGYGILLDFNSTLTDVLYGIYIDPSGSNNAGAAFSGLYITTDGAAMNGAGNQFCIQLVPGSGPGNGIYSTITVIDDDLDCRVINSSIVGSEGGAPAAMAINQPHIYLSSNYTSGAFAFSDQFGFIYATATMTDGGIGVYTKTGALINLNLNGGGGTPLISDSGIRLSITGTLYLTGTYAMVGVSSSITGGADAGATNLYGFNCTQTGNFTQAAATSNFYGVFIEYSGTWGTGGAQAGDLEGFHFAPTGTINGTAADVRGTHVDLTALTLSVVPASVRGHNIVLREAGTTGIYLACDSVDTNITSQLIGFQISADAVAAPVAITGALISGTYLMINHAAGPQPITNSQSMMDISYVMTRDGAAAMAWSGSILSFAVTPVNTPSVYGNKVSQTYGAIQVPNSTAFRGYYLEADATIGTGGPATVEVYGAHIDFAGSNGVLASITGFYGVLIQMPGPAATVWGVDVTAAIRAAGNGLTFEAIGDFGVKMVMDATAKQAIYIDQATTDTNEKNLIYVDVDCAAITGAAYFRGAYFDIDETVVGKDGSFIEGYRVDLTGFATGRADLCGYRVLIDGSKTGGDRTFGVCVRSTMTLNNVGEEFFGVSVDMSPMTLTSVSRATAHRIVLESKGQAIYIDQATTDSIEKNLIYADIDVASVTGAAYFRGIYLDIDETVVGNNGSFIVGYQIDISGFATGRADLIGINMILNGSKTGGDATIGIRIVPTITLNNAAEDFTGILMDMSGATPTNFNSITSISTIIDEKAVGTDGKTIMGHSVDITGFATGRADLIGMKIKYDGTKNGGDATYGIYIDSDLTLNHASEIFYGIFIDVNGMTSGNPSGCASLFGIYIDKSSPTYNVVPTIEGAIGIKTGTMNTVFVLTKTSGIDIAIQTIPVAGVTRSVQFDIPIAGGGAAGAALNWSFRFDSAHIAGLMAETNGAGAYQNPVFQIPYSEAAGFVAPTLPANAGNGSLKVVYDTGGGVNSMRIYAYTTGGWHYCTSAGGFTMPEMTDALSGEEWQMGDFFIGMVNKIVTNKDSYMHGLPVRLSDALQQSKWLTGRFETIEEKIERLETAVSQLEKENTELRELVARKAEN